MTDYPVCAWCHRSIKGGCVVTCRFGEVSFYHLTENPKGQDDVIREETCWVLSLAQPIASA